jgi:hypothetical protein
MNGLAGEPASQVFCQRACRGVAAGGILVQSLHRDHCEIARHCPGSVFRGLFRDARGNKSPEPLAGAARCPVIARSSAGMESPAERPPLCEKFVEHHAQTPHIARNGRRAGILRGHLRREIVGGAHDSRR